MPLAVPKVYSYKVPKELQQLIKFGVRVEVPLRNKLYAAVVISIHDEMPDTYAPRSIISVLDTAPIITPLQYQFWQWLSSYYSCTIGEVMNVALPSGLKLNSETRLVFNPNYQFDAQELSDDEYLVSEALAIQNELSIDQVKDILNKKSVYPIIKNLLDGGALSIKEELKQKYKPKKVAFVKLQKYYAEDTNRLSEALALCSRSELQQKAILAYSKLNNLHERIPKTAIYDLIGKKPSVIDTLVKKEVFTVYYEEVSRLKTYDQDVKSLTLLSEEQESAVTQLKEHFNKEDIALLHGVTGSGKTRIYFEMMKDTLAAGKQVLFLVPEIALTTQIVERVKAVFGNQVGLFHSKINNHERVELWQSTMSGKPIILGARSSIFLPFTNLGLIVVDEEHDSSYKQNDPAPRYNGRDAAIYMAQLAGAKLILGSATPSIESYAYAQNGRYKLVSLTQRYGYVALPEIEIVDLRQQYKTGKMKEFFSKPLMEAIQETLDRKEQVILFQNRRGYVPTIHCNVCGWTAMCSNCDVSLTKHKFFHEMRCHYCSYRSPLIKECPSCGNPDVKERGVGTEKIEQIVSELFPQAIAKRLDYDTVKSKTSFEKIITEFESGQFDILVGTQMVTKGLDFDNITLVGILSADSSLQFPNLRATERAFQLFTQVAGRAGRRKKQGKVIIQSFQPEHPVLADIVANNYDRFFRREMKERKLFVYPPYFKIIQINLKHKNAKIVAESARILAYSLRKEIGKRVLDPAEPGIGRIRGLYLYGVMIKMERDVKIIHKIKELILTKKHELLKVKGFGSLRINIDVDPY